MSMAFMRNCTAIKWCLTSFQKTNVKKPSASAGGFLNGMMLFNPT